VCLLTWNYNHTEEYTAGVPDLNSVSTTYENIARRITNHSSGYALRGTSKEALAGQKRLAVAPCNVEGVYSGGACSPAVSQRGSERSSSVGSKTSHISFCTTPDSFVTGLESVM
jgi:hypothetical protein